MDLLAPCTRHLIAPAWAAWERSPYLREYRRVRRTQYDSFETIRRRQWRGVQNILQHAYGTTDFWKRRFESAGLHPADIREPNDLRRVPLLTKHDLREHGPSMISRDYRLSELRCKSTSGSTGVAVKVFVDEPAMQQKRAFTVRSDEWSGYRFGRRRAMVWGNPEYVKYGWRGRLRNALLQRECYLDTLKMDEAAMQRFLEALRHKPPSLLFGHAHSLYLFAHFVESQGNAGFRPDGIIATAMVLHDWERRCIERAFGCPVTDRYGCEEVSLIACQCELHGGLHVNADGVYLEVIRSDGEPAEPGEVGALVVTDLVNRGMPVIRYQVGDMGAWARGACPCGRGLPLLERIAGRVADYVVTPEGDLISGISLTENFAMQVPGIAQLQIIQESVDRFCFRIVRGPEFGPQSSERIRELVLERFGPTVRYDCQYVSGIEPEPSGKYRFCISKVPNRYSMPVMTEA